MDASKSGNQFEVLSPWADVDPLPLKGISPRVKDLAGKKIGLAYNFKGAAHPIQTVVERKLKERYPTSEISWFYILSRNEQSPEDMKRFETEYAKWAKGVDTVITAVGD